MKTHKHQTSNDTSKNSDVKEKMTALQNNEETPFAVYFIKILGGFLWILKKNKQKEGNLFV